MSNPVPNSPVALDGAPCAPASLMMEHQPSEEVMSPPGQADELPVPVPFWIEWSNELAKEMFEKRQLQQLLHRGLTYLSS
jgi:hypothetical protein